MYGFDSSQYELETNQLPVGKYKVMITKEEVKDSQNPDNPKYLAVTYEIVEGELKGTAKQHTYNLFHKNQQTVNIARSDIKRIEIATGKPVNEASPLKNRVLVLNVTKNKKNPDFVDVKYFPESELTQSNDAPF